MEAKGCATPCVWKEARRRFYWSLRARLARSRLLAQFAEANPESSPEYPAQVLTQLAPPDASDMKKPAEMLETLDVGSTVFSLRTMRVVEALRKSSQVDRKATLNGLVELVRDLPDDEESSVLSALQVST